MCVLHGEGGDIELGSGSIFLSVPLFMSFVMIFIHLRMSDRPCNNNISTRNRDRRFDIGC